MAFGLAWILPTNVRALGDLGGTPPDRAPTALLEAESAAKGSVTIALGLAGAGGEERPVLDVRGRRTGAGNSGRFRVLTAHIFRAPCPGGYTLDVTQEDDLTGNTLVYTALVKLLDPEAQPHGRRCGPLPPRLPGHVGIKLRAPRKEPILNLDVDRQNPGPFSGSLTFVVFPECDDYRLETELDLPGWGRDIDFSFQVVEFSGSYQGRPIPKQEC